MDHLDREEAKVKLLYNIQGNIDHIETQWFWNATFNRELGVNLKQQVPDRDFFASKGNKELMRLLNKTAVLRVKVLSLKDMFTLIKNDINFIPNKCDDSKVSLTEQCLGLTIDSLIEIENWYEHHPNTIITYLDKHNLIEILGDDLDTLGSRMNNDHEIWHALHSIVSVVHDSFKKKISQI